MNYFSIDMPLPKVLTVESDRVHRFDETIYLLDKKWLVAKGWMSIPINNMDQDFNFGLWCKFDSQVISRFRRNEETALNATVGYLMSDVPFYMDGYEVEVALEFSADKPNFQEPSIYLREYPKSVKKDQVNGISIMKYNEWMTLIQQKKISEILPRNF